MMYNKGDIVLIPIPFTDLESTKVRPVVIISNDLYNDITDDILVSAITSNTSEKEYAIYIDNSNLAEGSLVKSSIIRVDKLYSLSQSIVKKKIGHLNKDIIDKVIEKINELCE